MTHKVRPNWRFPECKSASSLCLLQALKHTSLSSSLSQDPLPEGHQMYPHWSTGLWSKIFRLDFTQLMFKLMPPLQVCCSHRYRSKHTGAGSILSLILAEVVTVTLSLSTVVGLPFIWNKLNVKECVQRKWRKVGNGLPFKPRNKIRYKSSYEGWGRQPNIGGKGSQEQKNRRTTPSLYSQCPSLLSTLCLSPV